MTDEQWVAVALGVTAGLLLLIECMAFNLLDGWLQRRREKERKI